MTKRNALVFKPWIAALSLGATLGGWAMLARQDIAVAEDQPIQSPATPEAVMKAVHLELSPVPTVEALLAYAAPDAGRVQPRDDDLDLPPIPMVVAPAPRPQVIQTPAPQQATAPQQPQAPPPVATTQSSR